MSSSKLMLIASIRHVYFHSARPMKKPTLPLSETLTTNHLVRLSLAEIERCCKLTVVQTSRKKSREHPVTFKLLDGDYKTRSWRSMLQRFSEF